ncbi:MAG: TIGR02996 domain-containing protein [Deltaproteobacteria bacterium]|nr:TIGR02996 domain-containing protein [Deltaproteobacteria bacterium]
MFADEEQLLAQIRRSPHDYQLRLVYADALLARGDERGEYTALQVQLHVEHGKRPPEWHARMRELERHKSAWVEELGCGGFSAVWWRCGLPYELIGSVETFIANHEVLTRLPIVSIKLAQDARGLAALAALPGLAFIEEITLPRDTPSRHELGRGFIVDPLPRAELAALCASHNLGALRKLSFDDHALSEDTADVVGSSGVLARLEALSFKQITGTALERALAGKPLPRLKELVISNSQLREAGGRALASCAMPVLHHLALESAQLIEGAPLLLGSRNLATVQTLRIKRDQLIDDGAVGKSPHPRALREVSIAHTVVETKSVIALAGGGAMPFADLVTLELQQCSIEDAGAVALAKSTRFPRFAKLDLSSNRLTRDGVIAFAAPEAIPTLTSLGIAYNSFPSGTFQEEMEIDGATGMQMGIRSVEVPLGMDVIHSWFADRPRLRVF